MILESINIAKFRGFQNVEINFGSQITVVAGQNGTQKTTLLGIISQPFTITDKSNPMIKEKPLCGGNYKSGFSEKFRLSQKFDVEKSHEWTLKTSLLDKPFTLESMKRGGSSESIRFWTKGNRSAGTGYIQLPVIYLSLKRLLPIGEDLGIQEGTSFVLSNEELEFYKMWHNQILLIQQEIENANFLESRDKNTVGVNTKDYDWNQNSAGQDNIGKILLAIMSFKRLKENYPNHYKGGLLVIDEVDATLYPASQVELVKALRRFSSKYNLQIIMSTHSLSILEEVYTNQINPKIPGQNKILFLEKIDNKILINDDITFNSIVHKLNVTMGGIKMSKIETYVEDREAMIFAKAILKGLKSKLDFANSSLGCGNLIDLATRKVKSFSFPNSLVILDGDVKNESSKMKKVRPLKNVLLLPGDNSPERLIATFLYELSDTSYVWKQVDENFTKSLCFREYSYRNVMSCRETAKLWFNSHLKN